MAKVNVISHRGANKYAPQNTVPAFKKAVEIGVDGFETDVHLTCDNHIVICHNYTVDETSNGSGNVSDMTLERLRDLDFGSYFAPEFAGTTLPTLEEFLEICKNDDIKVMNIEIKEPKNGSKEIADRTISEVKNFGLFDKLLISSFDPAILVQCKKVDPAVKTGFLYSPDKSVTYYRMLFNYIEFAKELGVSALHPYYGFVWPGYVKKCHANGLEVNPWTVDSPDTVNKMLEWGVDGIITNVPDQVNKQIAEFEAANA